MQDTCRSATAPIFILTANADGVRELNGREDRSALIDRVHVKDGSSKSPGVPEEVTELRPG